MHSGIYADALLRSVALVIARNQVGQQRPITELLPSEGITQQEYDDLSKDPQFKQYVEAYAKELTESGFSFAAKSRVLAEDLLPIAYQMSRDLDVPAATRAKMIENLVEWGDLKPRKDATLALPGSGFSITINIPETSGPNSSEVSKNLMAIDVTPESEEEIEDNPQESVNSGDHSVGYDQFKKQIAAVIAGDCDDDYYDAEAES